MATAKKRSARKSAAKTTATPDSAPEQADAKPDAKPDRSAESLPIGAVIEHEGTDRWRVRVIGQPRWGHGKTHAEAVADYLTAPQ